MCAKQIMKGVDAFGNKVGPVVVYTTEKKFYYEEKIIDAKAKLHDYIEYLSENSRLEKQHVEPIFETLLECARTWEEGMARASIGTDWDFRNVARAPLNNSKLRKLVGETVKEAAKGDIQMDMVVAICDKWAKLCVGTLVPADKVSMRAVIAKLGLHTYEAERCSSAPDLWHPKQMPTPTLEMEVDGITQIIGEITLKHELLRARATKMRGNRSFDEKWAFIEEMVGNISKELEKPAGKMDEGKVNDALFSLGILDDMAAVEPLEAEADKLRKKLTPTDGEKTALYLIAATVKDIRQAKNRFRVVPIANEEEEIE